MITVLTWLWQQPGGAVEFTVDHVAIWAAMVRRHLHIPHRIACVTDMEGMPSHIERIEPPHEFDEVRIPTWGPDRPQCLRRISMFSPDAARIFGDRFLCMDLDVIIFDDITAMISDDDFRIAQGTAPSRPYNGSMMLMTAGSRSKVYQHFTPEGAEQAGKVFVGSDQAWISYCLGVRERVWTGNEGLCWYNGFPVLHPRIVFFPGKTKPWDLARRNVDDFVTEHYRGDRPERCLLLGYMPDVWDQAAAALQQGPVDAVIASPEAAEHWPGPVLAIAHSDAEANALARMHGFAEQVWCGRNLNEGFS